MTHFCAYSHFIFLRKPSIGRDYRTEKRVLQIVPTSGTTFTMLLNRSTPTVRARQFEIVSKNLLLVRRYPSVQ